MNFSYYDFGYLEKGKIVEVQLSAAANVRLMDSTNYSNYKNGRISDAKGLIDITTKVLNNGLRPHLTAWQAKYRAWYNSTLSDATATPQEIQRTYPEYQLLIDDLKKTNDIMIKYADELKRLIDYE